VRLRPAQLAAPAVLALALGVGLSGCGGGGDDDPPPTTADLNGALLAIDDVPEDYEQGEPTESSDDDNGVFAGTCFADIVDFEERAGEPQVEARTRFTQTEADIPSEISAGVSYYDDEPALAKAWDGFVADMSACTSGTTTTEGGATIDLTLTIDDSVSLEGADDQAEVTMAGTITGGQDSIPITIKAITVRLGHYISTVGTYDLGKDGSAGDEIGNLTAGQFERVRGLAD